MNKCLDSFASWLVGLPITWWLAEHGFMSARLLPLCIARAVEVPVRWEHLTGRVSINTADDDAVRTELPGAYQHE